jgi:hypothetical protein
MRNLPGYQPGDSGIYKGVRGERTCACGVALAVCKWPACQDDVEEHHVRQAIVEYGRLGRDEFLARYVFSEPDSDLLILDGKSYEPRAILGAAYKLATGRTLGPGDLGRGQHSAADVLRARGFELRSVRDWQPPASP